MISPIACAEALYFRKVALISGSTLGNSTHVTIPSIAREDPSDTLISTRAPSDPAFPCQDMRPPVLPKAHGGLFI